MHWTTEYFSLLSLPAHHNFLLLLGLCVITLLDDFTLYNHIQASSKIIPGTDYSAFKVNLTPAFAKALVQVKGARTTASQWGKMLSSLFFTLLLDT